MTEEEWKAFQLPHTLLFAIMEELEHIGDGIKAVPLAQEAFKAVV